MPGRLSCTAIALLIFAALRTSAQEPASTLPVQDLLAVQGKDKEPKDKGKPPVEPKEPAPDPFAQAPPESAEASRGLNPHTISDPLGYFTLRTVMVPGIQIIKTFQTVTTFVPVPTIVNNGQGVQIVIVQMPVTTHVPITLQRSTIVTTTTRIPLAGLGAFKISENQSPLPEDRAFLTYNYFNGSRSAGPSVLTQQGTFNGAPATFSSLVPAASPFDVHRVVFGGEKTLFDGSASVGLRVPVFDQHSSDFSQSDLGDITVFLNYAFYRDAAGSVLSGGLAVTLPTGPRVDTTEGNIHPFLFQPFLGYRLNGERFYLQGFTSVAVPTESQAVTALFNDVGIGYYLYRGDGDSRISALIPTVEAHVTTPLNHRRATDVLTVPDIVALTAGMHIGLGNRSLLTLGVTAPVTGPRPWNVEAVAQFNFRF